MEHDDPYWRFLKDNDGRVEAAVKAAFEVLGNSYGIVGTLRGVPRGGGATNPTCDELWCVILVGHEQHVHECMSVTDTHESMVERFVAALRSR